MLDRPPPLTDAPVAATDRASNDAGALPPPRTAVVLAAGRSERLRALTGGGSKALVRLGGLPLVERAIRGVLAHGIERVVVVVGYHAGPVAAAAKRASRRVRVVVAEDWEDGNGASLAAVERALEGERSFLLVTADHIFSAGALEPLLAEPRPASVLVDTRLDPVALEEATRVATDAAGHVTDIGKHVASTVADCGAFVLGPRVFDALRAARARGDATLAGAIDELASTEPVTVVPLRAAAWWQDVDTPDDLALARRALRGSLRSAGDGPVSRWVNRRMSIPISWALAPLRPPPDLLSVLAAALGFAAGVALGGGHGVLGAILAHLCSVLDGVDGEVARLTLRAGPRGALFDGVLDRLADVAIVAGLALWALAIGASPRSVVLLAVAATAGAVLSMATKDRLAALRLPGPSERLLGWLLGGRDGRLLLVAVLGLAGLPVVALAATAATSLTASVLRMLGARRAPSVA